MKLMKTTALGLIFLQAVERPYKIMWYAVKVDDMLTIFY